MERVETGELGIGRDEVGAPAVLDRSDGAGHEEAGAGRGGFPREGDGASRGLPRGAAEELRLRPEGARGEDVGPGGDVLAVDGEDEVGPFEDGAGAPEGGRGGGAAAGQLGPERGVEEERPLREEGAERRGVHSSRGGKAPEIGPCPKRAP